MRSQTLYLVALVALSVMTAAYEALLFWYGEAGSGSLQSVSHLLFVILLVLWIDADSKGRANVYRPYEFGWLVFIYWLPYVPFYLWRTRRAQGLAILAGLLLLYFLGLLAQWIIYLAWFPDA